MGIEFRGRIEGLPTAAGIIDHKVYNRQAQFRNVRRVHIEISKKYVNNDAVLRDVMLHEMCHAATWIIASKIGHGLMWRAWAALARQRLPGVPPVSQYHNYECVKPTRKRDKRV